MMSRKYFILIKHYYINHYCIKKSLFDIVLKIEFVYLL